MCLIFSAFSFLLDLDGLKLPRINVSCFFFPFCFFLTGSAAFTCSSPVATPAQSYCFIRLLLPFMVLDDLQVCLNNSACFCHHICALNVINVILCVCPTLLIGFSFILFTMHVLYAFFLTLTEFPLFSQWEMCSLISHLIIYRFCAENIAYVSHLTHLQA